MLIKRGRQASIIGHEKSLLFINYLPQKMKAVMPVFFCLYAVDAFPHIS